MSHLSFLLGYTRVENANKTSNLEAEIIAIHQELEFMGLDALSLKLRQASERIGAAEGMEEGIPAWLIEMQRDLIQEIAASEQ